MRVAIYLPLVIPLLVAAVAGPIARRLPPRAATWLLTVSALALALASSAVLGLLAPETRSRHPALPAAEPARPGDAGQPEKDLAARQR